MKRTTALPLSMSGTYPKGFPDNFDYLFRSTILEIFRPFRAMGGAHCFLIRPFQGFNRLPPGVAQEVIFRDKKWPPVLRPET